MGDVNMGGKLDLKVKEVKDVEVKKFHNIAPLAAHIKEINHIDPLTVEGFNVSEVRNIDPLRIQQFNVTNLPHVNLSLRQLPPVDMNIRRVPPLSVGIHQNFRLPSHYSISTQLLGFEVMRVMVQGETCVVPQDKYHREQSRTSHRSHAESASVGNPAIPAHHRTDSAAPGGTPTAAQKLDTARMSVASSMSPGAGGSASLRVGIPGIGGTEGAGLHHSGHHH